MSGNIVLSAREQVILDCACDLEDAGYAEAAAFLRAKVWVLGYTSEPRPTTGNDLLNAIRDGIAPNP